MLASASADRTVKLWDVATGERLDTFSQPLGEMYTVAFSPDGQRVAAGGVDNRVRIWQISDSGKEGSNPILYSRFAHERPIVKLLFSPDGKSFVSSAEDRTVKLWNAATVVERQLLESQPDSAPALAFAPDSKTLAVGRLDGTLAFYDASSGKLAPPAKPELAAIEPRGLQRGVTRRVQLSGKNLLDVIRVESDKDQVAAKVLGNPADDPGRVEIELTAAVDLQRGKYGLKVVTAGGTSKSIDIHVDDLPQLAETEPNDLPSDPTPVALPSVLWGTLSQMGDVDHVSFDAPAGQTIVCEIASRDIGGKANAVLTLFDSHGQVVASNNDFEGSEDPLLAYRPLAAGRYVLQINDLAQAGSADHFYRLSIGTFAYVTGGFPLSVAANAESEIELAGYNLAADARVKVAAAESGELEVPIDASKFRSRRPIKVLVGSLPETRESEPNDLPEQATAVAVPGTVGGRVWKPVADNRTTSEADSDLYRFESKQDQVWIVETEAERRGSPMDTKIDVLDAEGRPIERVLLQATRDSAINFRPINSAQLEDPRRQLGGDGAQRVYVLTGGGHPHLPAAAGPRLRVSVLYRARQPALLLQHQWHQSRRGRTVLHRRTVSTRHDFGGQRFAGFSAVLLQRRRWRASTGSRLAQSDSRRRPTASTWWRGGCSWRRWRSLCLSTDDSTAAAGILRVDQWKDLNSRSTNSISASCLRWPGSMACRPPVAWMGWCRSDTTPGASKSRMAS